MARSANNACKTFVTASDSDVVASFFAAEIRCKFFRVADVALEVGQFRCASFTNNLILSLASEMDFVPVEALETSLAAVAFLLSPSLARFARRLIIPFQSVSAAAVGSALVVFLGIARSRVVRDAMLAFPRATWFDTIFMYQIVDICVAGNTLRRYKGVMNPHVATAIAAHLETQLLSDLEADLHQDHSLNVFLFRVCWRVLSQISTESGAEELQEAVWSRRHAAAKEIGRKGTQQQ
jgi:hypothetical protein